MSPQPRAVRFERWLSDGEGRLRKYRLAVVLAGFDLLFFATYLAINEFSVGRPSRALFLPGEEQLPFLPIFTYVYVLTHFIPLLLVFTIRDYAAFRRLVRACLVMLVIAYSTYLLFPVYLERPRFEVASLDTWLLSLLYLDEPYNEFPSLHVAMSWLSVHASQVSRRTRIGLVILATAISLSTLLVKQHYIVDVAYGYALAWAAWRLAGPRRT